MIKTKVDRISHWILFLIWPLAALWVNLGVRKWDRLNTQITIAFCVFIGFNLVLGGEEGGSDSGRYAVELEEMYLSGITVAEFKKSLYNENTREVDVYQPFITFVVAQLVSDARVLFAIFSLIFGYFWIQNVRIVSMHTKLGVGSFAFLLIVGYLLVNPIWNVNGVRMWTATHVFAYGSMLAILERDKRGYLLIASTPLIHWSFLIVVLLWLLFLGIKKIRISMYILLFLVSALFEVVEIEGIRVLEQYLPDVIADRSSSYTNELALEKRERGNNFSWHYTLAITIKKWFTIAMVIILGVDRNILSKFSEKWILVAKLGLLIGSIGYILNQFPSGGRFLTVSSMFLFPVFIHYASAIQVFKKRWYKSLSLLLSVPMIFWYVVMIRKGFGFIGFNTLFGNVVTSIFYAENYSVMNFLKDLIG